MLRVIISYILGTQAANEYLTAHTTPKIQSVLHSTVCKKGDRNLYQSAKPNAVCKMYIDVLKKCYSIRTNEESAYIHTSFQSN